MIKKIFIVLLIVVPIGLYITHYITTKRIIAVQVTNHDITEILIATGKFSTNRNTALGFEQSGVLAELLVKEGDMVKKGDLLASLDHQDMDAQIMKAVSAVNVAEKDLERVKRPTLPEDLERLKAGVDSAKANVKQAQLDLKRAEQLGAYASDVDRDTAYTKLELARAQERQANAQLSLALRLPLVEEVALAESQFNSAKASLVQIKVLASRRELRAPYDGLVLNRLIEVGASVPLGSSVLRIAEISAPEILVDTDEANLGKLKLGQIAIVTAMGYPGHSFEAELKRIGPAVDSQRGVIPLMLKPLTVPDWVRIDMTIDVSIETAKFKNIATLPSSAVFEKHNNAYVVISENGLSKMQAVKVLGRGKEGVAIEGLSAGTWVAQYASAVEEGQKISLIQK